MLAYIAIFRSCTQHDLMETYGMRMRVYTATLTRTFAVHSSEHWIKSKFTRISLNTVREVLFLHRGTFLHAFYFISITTHEHTITLCCGAQKNRFIEANYLSNEDTFKMIHCCSTLQQQHIYDIYLLGSSILGPSHE